MAAHATLAHRSDAPVSATQLRRAVGMTAGAAHQAWRRERHMAIAAVEASVPSDTDREGQLVRARSQRTLREPELEVRGHEHGRPARGAMTVGTVLRQRRLSSCPYVQGMNIGPTVVSRVTGVAIRGRAGPNALSASLVTFAALDECVHAGQGQARASMLLEGTHVLKGS